MWKSITADSNRYGKSFTYLKRSAVKKAGGKGSFNFSNRIEGVPLVFIPESINVVMTEDGNLTKSTAEAVISAKFFSDNNITPTINDRLEDGNGIQYRIINFADYRNPAHSYIYHIFLRRDELAL